MLGESPAAAPGRTMPPPIALYKWIAGETGRCDPVGEMVRDVVNDISMSNQKLNYEIQKLEAGTYLNLECPRNEEEQLSLRKAVEKYKTSRGM